jgi:hypothetical protein
MVSCPVVLPLVHERQCEQGEQKGWQIAAPKQRDHQSLEPGIKHAPLLPAEPQSVEHHLRPMVPVERVLVNRRGWVRYRFGAEHG